MTSAPWLPQHDEIRFGQRAFEAVAIVAALGLLACNVLRIGTAPDDLASWLPLVFLAGVAAADFSSGLLHWFADTWGSESMPVLGRRLLRPFRVHHVNPRDFLRRDFLDTNGDVAAILVPVLLGALLLPLDTGAGRVFAVFFVSMAAGGLLTNQVHQWAHMPKPPRVVGWLQRHGLLLDRAAHARHHKAPHTQSYCIATGWLNRPLTAIEFFPRAERLVTRLLGFEPRSDDARFRAGIEAARLRARFQRGGGGAR